MKYPNIPLTEKEIQAIENYTGYKHTRINIIADMQPEKYKELQSSWNLDSTSEQLEELIEEFVNIYAAIYKQGSVEGRGRLYRGTTKKEAEQLRENKELKTFLSTTLEEITAKTFCEYGNAAIIRVRTEQGLPYLYVEPYKEEEKRNEKEILILPFSKVKKAEYTSNWNGYSYYDVTVQKEELPEVEPEELDSLKNQCLEEFSSFQEQIKQYNSLREEIEALDIRSRMVGREELTYIYQIRDSKAKQAYLVSDKIDEYRNNFTRMLKGMCKQKEKDIDQQREEIIEQDRREKERREKERIERVKLETEKLKIELNHQLENLEGILDFNLEQLIKNADLYKETAQRMGISYTQLPPYNLLEKVELIKQELEKRIQPQKEVDEEYENMLREKVKLERVENDLRILPNMINNHANQSMQEIKFNLNEQVREMIYRTRWSKLQEEREAILMKKDSIWQKITGKNRMKEEELKNIEARVNLAKNDFNTMNPENRVGKMLESIYECAYENGEFTQEMVDMINKIRSNFECLPEEQELSRKAIEKATNAYPIVSGQKQPFFFRRRMVEIQNQTRMIEENARKVMTRKKRKPPIEMNIIAEIEGKMNHIYDKIKEDYRQEEMEKEPIGNEL